VKDSQPAWQLRDKDELNKAAAVRELLLKNPDIRPRKVYEFFGGLGGVTREVRDLYPEAQIHSWDMDPVCAEKLLGLGLSRHAVTCGDSLNNCYPSEDSLILMDFNLWTLHRAKTKYKSIKIRESSEG